MDSERPGAVGLLGEEQYKREAVLAFLLPSSGTAEEEPLVTMWRFVGFSLCLAWRTTTCLWPVALSGPVLGL